MLSSLRIAAIALALNASAVAHDGEHDPPSASAPLQTNGGVDLSLPPIEVTGASCKTDLHLVDQASGEHSYGVVRVSTLDGRVIQLNGLRSRAEVLAPGSIGESAHTHMNSWSILPGRATVDLPRAPVRIECFRGLEHFMANTAVDLTGKATHRQELTLVSAHPEGSPHWHAGNTHLHQQRMTLAEAEDYACETAAADGYDIVFFSYLERANADEHYISNQFTHTDLARFTKRSGVLFGYGEEYRHNLVDHHEGYGHVMFLDLPQLILPASLGQSITKSGNDDMPLRPGILLAREQDATVLWCHGARGLEDVPSWLAGLIDVQMIFDQGSLGTYEEALYRYWSLGLNVPIATGTDWFFRDMATVFARSEAPLSTDTWLRALREGRSYISNGPLLELSVNDSPIGSTLALTAGQPITIQASARSAMEFGALEIVVNGTVYQAPARVQGAGFAATLTEQFRAQESCWIAARITPFDANYDRPETTNGYFNPYGKPIFAHTSPIYVRVDSAPIFQPEAARALVNDLEGSREVLVEKGDFSSKNARDEVLTIYDEAIRMLNERM